MKKYLVLGVLVLMITASLDAAPRGRRRARRQSRKAPAVSNMRYQSPTVYRTTATSVPATTQGNSGVAQANFEQATLDIGDPLPSVPSATSAVVTASATETPPAAAAAPVRATNPALAELNQQRARRGLRPFLEDPLLTAIARRKAQIQASRGYVGHPGGSMGGARFEGVGMGQNFITCYQYSNNGTYAGAASVMGRNGRRYHCLLLR